MNISSPNRRSQLVCEGLNSFLDDHDVIRTFDQGVEILDFGTDRIGTLDAGLVLTRICMGDLATVQYGWNETLGMPSVEVRTNQPLLACIASQYAGWPLSHDDFFAMGSGPARMARGKEEILDKYQLTSSVEHPIVVLEGAEKPNADVCQTILDECEAKSATVCIAKTSSLPGSTQVVGRSIETALHKLNELGFDLRKVLAGSGTAPLPPLGKKDITSLGRTNDAVLYGGQVHLWVDASEKELTEIGPQIPSCSSASFGQPFLRLFEEAGYDFYQMDKSLFSPACVTINNTQTGTCHRFGRTRYDILEASFGIEA